MGTDRLANQEPSTQKQNDRTRPHADQTEHNLVSCMHARASWMGTAPARGSARAKIEAPHPVILTTPVEIS